MYLIIKSSLTSTCVFLFSLRRVSDTSILCVHRQSSYLILVKETTCILQTINELIFIIERLQQNESQAIMFLFSECVRIV